MLAILEIYPKNSEAHVINAQLCGFEINGKHISAV